MKHKNKSIINVTITAITLSAIGIGSVFLFGFFSDRAANESTSDAQVNAYINPISARANGYIHSIRFEENQYVHKGDTLITLDDQEYKLKIQAAQADLENAKGQLNALKAEISAASIATKVGKDHIAAAKTRLWQQQQDIDRYSKLLEQQAVTGQQFEQVKARYDIAGSDFSASKNALSVSYAKIEELNTRLAIIEALIKAKETQLDFSRLSLSYTIITAPKDGRIGRRLINEGVQIKEGQPLVYLIKEGQKWVTANFKETQIAGMEVGQLVSIHIDALGSRLFHGVIESISGATGSSFSLLPTDNATGNFVRITQRIPVKIRFTDVDLNKVKVGMNAQVSINKLNR